MPVFSVELDDGRILDIDAEDEQQAQQAVEQFLSQPAQEQPAQQPQGEPSQPQGLAAFMPGLRNLAAGKSPIGDTQQETQHQSEQATEVVRQAVNAGMLRTAEGIVNFGATAAGKVLDLLGADQLEQHVLDWRDKVFRPASQTANEDLRKLRKNKFAQVDLSLTPEDDKFFEKASELAVQVALPVGGKVEAARLSGAKALDILLKKFMGRPGRGVAQATTLLGRGAGQGTLLGGIGLDEENPDEQLTNAALGTLFGAGFGLLPATRAGWRAWISRRTRDLEGQSAQRFYQLAQKYDTGGSVGQATGHNLLMWLERRQPVRSLATLVDQSGAVYERVNSMIKSMPDMGAGRVAEIAGQSLRTAQALLRKRRSATFKSGMRKINALHPDAHIDSSGLLRSMDSIDALVKRRAMSDLEMSSGFQRMHARLRNAQQAGGMTVRDVNDYLVALEGVSSGRSGSLFKNAEQAGVADMQREYARQMRNALMEDLMKAEQSGEFSKQARGILKAIREDYAAVTEELKSTRRTLLAKMAGVKPDDPDVTRKMSRMLAEATPTEQAKLVKSLRSLGMEGMGAIQGARKIMLKSAVDAGLAAVRTAPDELPKFDLPAFLKTLSRSQSELVGEGLFSSKQLGELKEAGFFIRKVLNRPDLGRPGLGLQTITPEDISINAAARNPAFVTRVLTRVLFFGRGLETLLFDTKGRRILQDLATAPPDSPAMRSAISKLLVVGLEPDYYDSEGEF